MARTAAEVMVDTLIDWGVDVIFGLPGDGINGIIEALRKCKDRIRFIQVRHEEAAAFMACGYAKFTGRLGACIATSGPGGIHLLNGLYDAKLDGQPVLAITGLQFHDLIGTYTQQDVALDRLFEDVSVFNQRIMGATHAQNITELACRAALARRGVAHVTIPVDIQDQSLKQDMRSPRNKANHVSDEFARGARRPEPHEIQALVLNIHGNRHMRNTSSRQRRAASKFCNVLSVCRSHNALVEDSHILKQAIKRNVLLRVRPNQVVKLEACDRQYGLPIELRVV
jgi:pyruvate dehydrogenase (quinone)